MDTPGPGPEFVRREKLEHAFETIRKDVAYLQRDLAYAEANRTRWVFVIMWLALTPLVRDLLRIDLIPSLGLSALLAAGYRLVDGLRITRRAIRSFSEPLEPAWDTKVDLS